MTPDTEARTVDLRSDTVTTPTPEMRAAMFAAEVGDDVYGEDPTVRRLEETVAGVLGKEAGLFVPSGVMGNQIAIRLHTRPGDEAVVAERSHIYHYEGGGPAALWGVQLRPVGGTSGVLEPADLAAVIQGAYDWEARTRLVCLENTVNKAGGVAVSLSQTMPVVDLARQHGLALHLDGARLWNAAVALGASAEALCAPFDTVNVCLSKGLGAPVGSVLAGSRDAMREARRVRKLLGGGMRQAGILAAAGLMALGNRARLADDHARAKRLAAAAAAAGFTLARQPDTNIVLFDTPGQTAADVVARLGADGIRASAFGPQTVRLTTHLDVNDAGIERATEALGRAAHRA